MPAYRKVVPVGQHAPCAALPSFVHAGIDAVNPAIARHHIRAGVVREQGCPAKQGPIDATRRLFFAARNGETKSFERLLGKRRVGAANINFQYSSRTAQHEGGNLWPWYWCVDACDALELCWGAPAGVEPEQGDTLLMISLKIGLEEHTRHLLNHRALDLGIENSSGRNAAAVAERYGRESLISRQQARYDIRCQRKRQVQHRPSARKLQRRSKQPRPCMDTHDIMMSEAGRPHAEFFSSGPSSNSPRALPGADEMLSRGMKAEGLPEGSKNRVNQGINASEESLKAASNGERDEAASAAPAPAGLLDLSQKNNKQDVHDGLEPAKGPGAAADKKSTNSCPMDSCEVHPPPRSTRAIAVQTEPEDIETERATTPAVGQAQQIAGPGAEATRSSLSQGCSAGDANLQTASRGIQRLEAEIPVFVTVEGIEGERPGGRRNFREITPHSSLPLDQEMTGGEFPAAPSMDNDGRIGSGSGEAHQIAAEGPSTPTSDTLGCLPHGTVDQIANGRTAASDSGNDAGLLQGVLNRGVEAGRTSAGSAVVAHEVDPLFEARSKIDEVTRELQRLLREDALQDDGILDYSASFEIFDVDHDGNATPDELHAIFIRLGMGNLLSEEGIAVIVDRVPRDSSGLVTQKELEIFAERPPDFQWPFPREESGGQAAEQQGGGWGEGVEPDSGIAVTLHELQVKAASSGNGMYSWKKVSKDFSAMSLFLRVTRGRHVVESAAVASRLLSSGGGGEGGTEIMNDAEDGEAIWAWRWGEVLTLPGPSRRTSAGVPLGPSLVVAGDEGGESTVVCPEEESGPGGEGHLENGVVDDPFAAAASKAEEGQGFCDTKPPDTNRTTSAREEASALNDVNSKIAAEHGLQDDDDSCSTESDASSSEIDSSSVIATAESDQKQEKARVEFAPDLTKSDSSSLGTREKANDTTGSKASVLANLPQGGSGGAKTKRRVSFWSPTRGRGKENASIARSDAIGSSAGSATPRATVAAAGNIPDKDESSGGPNNDIVERDDPGIVDTSEEAGSGSTGDSFNSDGSCPNTTAGINDGSTAIDEEGDASESAGGKLNKRGLPFWSPIRGKRKQTSATTATATPRKDVARSDGTAADSTTPRVTVVAVDDIAGNVESSGTPNTDSSFETDAPGTADKSIPQDRSWSKNEDKEDTEEARGGSTGDSVNSEDSCLNTSSGIDGGSAAGEEEVDADESPGGILRKRGLSFWSPRRGRRKQTSTTTATATQRSDVGSGDGTAAEATTPRVTVAAADDNQGHIEPSGHPNTDSSVESDAPGGVGTSSPQDQSWAKNGNKEDKDKAGGGSAGDSVNSEDSCPKTLAGINNGSAAGEEEVDATESPGGMCRKRGVSFWSHRRGRRESTSTTTVTATPRSAVGRSDDTTANATTPRVTVAAAGKFPGGGESSFNPNTGRSVERHVPGAINTTTPQVINWTSNGEHGDKEEAGGGSTGDSISSDDDCLDTPANAKGKTTRKPSVQAKRPPSFSRGAKVKRGVSFWSPTRGRGKKNVSFAGKKAVGSNDCTTADATTPRVTVAAADGIPGSDKSSGDPNTDSSVPGGVDAKIPPRKNWTKSGHKEDTVEGSGESTGDSINSEDSCPNKPPGTNDGSTAAGDEVVATNPAGGMLNRRKLSFWSPRRGRQKETATIAATPNSDVGASNCGSEEAASTTADNADEVLDKLSSDDESRSDSDDSESGNESSAVIDKHVRLDRVWPKSFGEENARGESSKGADPPDDSCSEFSVKAADAAVVAIVECTDPGATRKLGARFWSPRRERKKNIALDAIAPRSACDREEPTAAVGTSDPQESDRKARDVQGGADGVAPGSLPKRAGGSLWSLRSKGSSGPTRKHRDTNGKNGDSVEVRRREQARGPAALEEPFPLDVLVLEVWEISTPAALHPYTAQDATISAPVEGSSGRQRSVQSTRNHDRMETNSNRSLPLEAVAEDTDQPVQCPQDKRQPVEPGDESLGGLSPTSADNLCDSGTERGGINDSNDAKLDTDLSTPRWGCADDDHVSVGDGGDSVADDDASVASAATTKNTRRRNPILLLSPFKGRKNKNRGQSSRTSSESPLTSSETEGTVDTGGLDGDKDPPQTPVDEGGEQKVDVSDMSRQCAINDTNHFSSALNVQEESGSEKVDDGEDEDVSVATQSSFPSGISAATETSSPKNAGGSVFTMSFKGRKTNKMSAQQQLAKSYEFRSPGQLEKDEGETQGQSTGRSTSTPRAKPVLWGRLTIPVEDTMQTGDKGIMDTNVERPGTAPHALGESIGTTGMTTVDISADQTSMSERGRGSPSVFGVSVPGLSPRKKRAKDETDSLVRGATDVRVVDRMPSRSPPRPGSPCLDGWFEVRYPKGRRGKKVKGMVRLTLTPCR
ncbi:unnamed protein product [Ectocarpus sp. 13 AM-2016]